MAGAVGLENSGMKTMNSWQDVEPFAGRFVAYKTNSYYLGAGRGYVLEDPSLRFGCIANHKSHWESWAGSKGGWGYDMDRILNPKEIGGICTLTDSDCQQGCLSMRLASVEEITAICQAVIQGKAKFGGRTTDEQVPLAQKILEGLKNN